MPAAKRTASLHPGELDRIRITDCERHTIVIQWRCGKGDFNQVG
jgi:hypothetical protein